MFVAGGVQSAVSPTSLWQWCSVGKMLYLARGNFSLQYHKWPLGKKEARLSSSATSSSNNTSMHWGWKRKRGAHGDHVTGSTSMTFKINKLFSIVKKTGWDSSLTQPVTVLCNPTQAWITDHITNPCVCYGSNTSLHDHGVNCCHWWVLRGPKAPLSPCATPPWSQAGLQKMHHSFLAWYYTNRGNLCAKQLSSALRGKNSLV